MLLTDLPSDALERVLAHAAPRDIASALCSCKTLSVIEPWRSAFELRWGAPGLEVRTSVSKYAYLLRHVCELVSGDSELAMERHESRQRHLDHDLHTEFECCDTSEEEARMQQREGDECSESDESDSSDSMDLRLVDVESVFRARTTHEPDRSRAGALHAVDQALAQCATSAASASALMAVLTAGLYVLLDETNVGENPYEQDDEDFKTTWRSNRFVLASPRGDLVAFHSQEVRAFEEHSQHDSFGREWFLRAIVVGVADEPRLSKAMRGSQRLRDEKLLSWLDELFIGKRLKLDRAGRPTRYAQYRELVPSERLGERRTLVDCTSADDAWSPSPAEVASLLDSLGLDKRVVHADDLLLALLVISKMVPAHRVAEVWGAPPPVDDDDDDDDEEWEEDDGQHFPIHPGVCLWKTLDSSESDAGSDGSERPEWTRLTWALAASQ